MKFSTHFNKIMEVLDEGVFKKSDDEEQAPDVNDEEQAPDVATEGDVEDLDPEDTMNTDSALEDPVNDDVDDIVDSVDDEEEMKKDLVNVGLVKVLLDALRFKPTKEFKAYINMPMFTSASPEKKLHILRSVMSKHKDRIVKEADETMMPDMGMVDGGGGDAPEDNSFDDTPEFIMRLIMRCINTNPYVLNYSLQSLPTEVTQDNYKGIIATIKTVLL